MRNGQIKKFRMLFDARAAALRATPLRRDLGKTFSAKGLHRGGGVVSVGSVAAHFIAYAFDCL